MGQSSILLVIAATLTIGILLYATQRGTSSADEDLADYHNVVLAREAASTGVYATARRLASDDTGWEVNPASYQFTDEPFHGAEFTTVVTAVDANTVDIVSTGTHADGDHVIEARYERGNTSGGVPPQFRYAVISDGDMRLSGNTDIRAARPDMNSDIHANGDLRASGNVDVDGYGTSGPDEGDPSVSGNAEFDPNVGDPPYTFEGDHIDIPLIDYRDFNSIPPADVMLGSQHWSGNTTKDFGGTYNDPALVYIDGDLSVSGNVEVLGYVQFVVRGDVSMSGNSQLAGSQNSMPSWNASQSTWDAWYAQGGLDNNGQTSFGIYSTGDIRLSGNSKLAGHLYANGDVRLSGNSYMVGGVTSASADLRMSGNTKIRYAQISEAGVLPGWEWSTPDGMRLVNWAEW